LRWSTRTPARRSLWSTRRLVTAIADHDRVRLWTHLPTGVERLGEGLGRRALVSLASPVHRFRRSVDEQMNGLVAYVGPVSIVLDDLHTVTRRSELAFMVDENARVDRPRGDRAVRRSVELLLERTEGWPAGLYLPALSLHDLELREHGHQPRQRHGCRPRLRAQAIRVQWHRQAGRVRPQTGCPKRRCTITPASMPWQTESPLRNRSRRRAPARRPRTKAGHHRPEFSSVLTVAVGVATARPSSRDPDAVLTASKRELADSPAWMGPRALRHYLHLDAGDQPDQR